MTAPDDGLGRCDWAFGRPGGPDFELYRDYHDKEWGQPLHGRGPLFERMSLEAFQSGLSWLIILRKRAKIEATIANARAAADVDDLSELLWSFAPAPRSRPVTIADIPATTPESTAMARELKRR